MTAHVEQREFQAEARQLLQLMIHSVYSNKDTFLRELISNASDALDKLKLAAYQDKELEADTSDLHIELAADAGARTLTVTDNGVGMSREEVVDLIGTLAKSGTAQLRQALAQARKDGSPEAASDTAELIGQFGIGFYSTFMVADKVTMTTRKAGEARATRWESEGDGTYTLEELESAPQGTSITLHLKPEDADDHLHDFTSEWKLREVVKRYSDFISYPIRMDKVTTTPAAGADGEVEEAAAEVTVETVTLNSMKALWARPRDEVTAEEYTEFYRHVSHAWDEPLETIAMRGEGTFEYQALLFLPSTAPFDLFTREHKRGVQLYVKRVFIMDNCEELMPAYLRFVKGIVDAADLSLNVSREILQQNRQITAIRKRLVKKVLATVKAMRESDPGKYRTFWTHFGAVVKEGLLFDADNRQAILDICTFATTHTAPEAGAAEAGETDGAQAGGAQAGGAQAPGTTLAEYVARMKDGQERIYFMTGESRALVENSPHMEAFAAKGVEVLVLTDPVDEMWVDSVREYEGKAFQSIAKGAADLDGIGGDGTGDDTAEAARDEEFAGLLGWLKEALAGEVKDVRLSKRLTTSPACLVGDAFDMSPALERMYKASGQPVPHSKRVLEVNPGHALVAGLRAAQADRPGEQGLKDTAQLLYGMAVLAEGGELDDPAKFTRILAERLAGSL